MPTLPQSALCKEALHKAVEMACAGRALSRSPQAVRLLRHLVEREQAGDLARLRETVIGHELSGRDENYDPKQDAVVRVNATRLRQRLEEHYWQLPKQDVRIILRVGSYVPTYEWTAIQERSPEPADESETNSEVPPGGPDILAAPLVDPPVLVNTLPTPARVSSKGRRTLIVGLVLALGCVCLLAMTLVRIPRRMPTQETWEARPFARTGGSQQFSDFSPDGRRLAFVSSSLGDTHKMIYVQDLGSDTPRQLTDASEDDTQPAWSPDGTRIAFVRLQPNANRLLVLYSFRDSSETPVVTLRGNSSWPCRYSSLSWSRDGRFLFASGLTGSSLTCALVRVDLATHAVSALTQPPVGTTGDLDAVPSPDGKSIAFVRNFSFMSTDIFLLDFVSGAMRQITHEKRNIGGFRWSPDGTSLILSSNRVDGQTRLWRMPLDGGTPMALTNGSTNPTYPAIASNGRLISFTEFHSIGDLWRRTYGATTQILGNGTANSAPSVSSDGKRLVFNSYRSGLWMLWVSESDGRNPVQLLHDASQLAPSGAIWSTDGQQIAFECRETGNSNLCVVNADGSNLQHLTHDASNHILPSWSRNGKSLYYSSDVSGTSQIYRIPRVGGTAVQVTRLGGVRAVESWDGSTLYVHRGAPQGGIVAIRTADIGSAMSPVAESTVLLARLGPNQLGDWNPGKGNSILFLAASASKVLPRLMSFDPSSGRTTSLGALDTQAGTGTVNFNVTSDGSVYYRKQTSHTDLSLLEKRQ